MFKLCSSGYGSHSSSSQPAYCRAVPLLVRSRSWQRQRPARAAATTRSGRPRRINSVEPHSRWRLALLHQRQRQLALAGGGAGLPRLGLMIKFGLGTLVHVLVHRKIRGIFDSLDSAATIDRPARTRSTVRRRRWTAWPRPHDQIQLILDVVRDAHRFSGAFLSFFSIQPRRPDQSLVNVSETGCFDR